MFYRFPHGDELAEEDDKTMSSGEYKYRIIRHFARNKAGFKQYVQRHLPHVRIKASLTMDMLAGCCDKANVPLLVPK